MSSTSIQESQALAQAEAAATAQPSFADEVVTFNLGSEEYAIDIRCVQEIRRYEKPTRLATAPASMKGVIDLRGNIVGLYDMRTHVGMPETTYDSDTVIIVLRMTGGSLVGAIVDAVTDVTALPPGTVKPLPDMASNIPKAFIRGVASVGDEKFKRLLVLLDIVAMLGKGAAATASNMPAAV